MAQVPATLSVMLSLGGFNQPINTKERREYSMYPILLSLHNIMRWLVVIAAVWLLIRTYMGLFSKSDWTDQEGKAVRFFVIFMDIQLLLGLILYFVSPLTQVVMAQYGGGNGR